MSEKQSVSNDKNLIEKIAQLLGNHLRDEIESVVHIPDGISPHMTSEDVSRLLCGKNVYEMIDIYIASIGIHNLHSECALLIAQMAYNLTDSHKTTSTQCADLASLIPHSLRDIQGLLFQKAVDLADNAQECFHIIKKSQIGHVTHTHAVAKMRTFLTTALARQITPEGYIEIVKDFPLDEVRCTAFEKMRTLSPELKHWVSMYGVVPKNSEWSKICIREIAISMS